MSIGFTSTLSPFPNWLQIVLTFQKPSAVIRAILMKLFRKIISIFLNFISEICDYATSILEEMVSKKTKKSLTLACQMVFTAATPVEPDLAYIEKLAITSEMAF